MSIKRWAAKRDANQTEIVKALEKAGAKVEFIGWPCDLIVRFRGVVQVIEIEGITRNRRRDAKQLKFLGEWSVPRVHTVEEALRAIGAIGN